MAEGSCPQVFVVDMSTSDVQHKPNRQKPIWKRVSKRFLLPLLGLVAFGLVVEGIFVYRLYKKTEALSIVMSYSLYQNQSRPQTPALDGNARRQVGPEVSNEIPTQTPRPEGLKQRPMAHLQGSDAIGKDGVVQWVKNSDGFTNHIGHNNSGLLIEKKGYYYLYSKVHIQETEDCVLVNHKVIKKTTAYGLPIELMRSRRLHCSTECSSKKTLKKDKDLWNSFLSGIFLLESGDLIFVTLDKGLYAGPADNFLGAFMIS